MEHFSETCIDDENIADPLAGNSENPKSESQVTPTRPSAIERQIAATAPFGESTPTYATVPPRNRRRKTDRRKTRRFGFGGFLILLWLVAVGLMVIFTDFGRMLNKRGGDVAQVVPDTATNTTPLLTAPSSSTPSSTTQPSSTNPSSPNNSVQTATPNEIADTSFSAVPTADSISIPIAEISLRNNPALVEQLVQVYRSRLAADPHDTTTQTALERLHEQSLADIQMLIPQGDAATVDKSLQIIAHLFPEWTDNVRYKYLVARANYMRRQKDDPAIKAEVAIKSESKIKPEPASAVVESQKITSEKITAAAVPISSSAEKLSSPSTTIAKKVESVSSTKPEIRSVSIMPGAMINDNFVPRDGGNVFMVEISYSNFNRVFIEHPAATLVALLGIPDDPMVLAEVPVIITADRGTKSFIMETNNVEGYAGGKFQLNFMLNDEFLTSRTLRLSRPR